MKIIIRIGLLLAILGTILAGVFGLLANEALQAEIELTAVSYTYDKDRFSSIDVTFENHPVIIQKSETDEIVISFSHDKFETITVTEQENKLIIKESSKWYERFFSRTSIFNMTNIFQNRTVYVSLPEQVYNVQANTSNGQITLKDLTLGLVVLKTSNGMIGVENVGLVTLIANTSNGGIDLKNVNATSIECDTSNGSLVFSNVNASAIDGKTSNGKITALDIVSSNLKLNSSNGRISIKVTGAFADYRVKTLTSNGNVKINNQVYGNDTYHQDKTPFVSAKTSNGDISIEFSLD